MYDPEESFTANVQFDEIVARVDRFIEDMATMPGDEGVILGEKLRACIELLRGQYDEYLNEFEPHAKAKLHKHWQIKICELINLIRTMTEEMGKDDE